jgi:PAS domain S-box-containing protein
MKFDIMANMRNNKLQNNSSIMESQLEKNKSLIKRLLLTQKQLNSIEKQYNGLFELTNDGIFLISLDQHFLDANYNATKMLGCSKEEIIGMSILSFLAPEEREDAKMKAELLLSKVQLPIYERQFIRKDGTTFVGEINASLVRNEKGEPQYIQSAVRDISEKRRYQEKIKQQRDELDNFSTMVAHDIKGKLQVLSLYLDSMPDSLLCRKAMNEVDEVNDFMDNLLLLAKKGLVLEEITDVNLNKVIGKLVSKLAPLNPKLEFNLQKLPTVKGDENKLFQIFENLLLNTIQHANATKIRIFSKENDEEYIITIQDNGKGMTKEEIEEIIQQLNTKTIKHLGFGIITKLVQAHEGNLTIQNNVGKGVRIDLSFPKK